MQQDALQVKTGEAKTLMQATWTERGVLGSNVEAQQRLGMIGGIVLRGYHLSIANNALEAIASSLNEVEDELRGFAYEGVGMGLTQRDLLTPSNQNRVETLATGLAAAYHNWIYVGVGLMLGRAGLPIELHLERLTPERGWLVMDGYGYHYGVFNWRESLDRQALPEQVSGYARQVFDQGLGRSIWFVDGGTVDRISRTMSAFPVARQADLWGGVGYASAYAGGATRETIEALQAAAGPFRSHLAQGTAFAAKARHRLANPSIYTELACQVLWGQGISAVAKLFDTPTVSGSATQETWQHYRSRIQHPVSNVASV